MPSTKETRPPEAASHEREAGASRAGGGGRGGGAPRMPEAVDVARAKTIVDVARDAIVSIDARGTITAFNPAAETMFGFSAAEAVGRNVGLIMPFPYRDQHDAYVEQYRRTGETRAIGHIRQVEAQRSNGEVFPIELSVAEMFVDGEPTYTAIIRDVSAFRSMVEALRHERDFSNRLIDAAPMIVLVLDGHGSVLRINRYLEDLCGYRLDEIRGSDAVSLLVAEPDRTGVREVIDGALAGAVVRGYVNRLVSRSGSVRTIRWSGELLRGNDGAPNALLAVGEDITDRVRADEELRRLEQRAREQERLADVGAIAAGLVHDLGNPLSGLSMQAQLLQRRAEKNGDESILQPSQRILAAAAQLNALIRGFMDFAREQRLDLQPIELSAMLRELVAMWSPVAQQVGIEISLSIGDEVPQVDGDGAKLRRVFDNLVRNAIEAIAAQAREGRVNVRLDDRDGDGVRVRVEDDGPGVRPGVDVFRLFETTKPNGTGIGLAVAKQIVIAHGGTVSFHDLEPHGASFVVDLPARGSR